MKRNLLFLYLMICACALSAKTVNTPVINDVAAEPSWQAKTDTIWPARHYRERDGVATGDQRTDAWIDWKHAEGTVLVYGLHFPTGHVRADAVFTAQSGKKVTFRVRIVHPMTGTVVLETTATSMKTSTAEQTMEIMPDTEMPYDGWYRFELTCPDGVNTLNRLNLLLFQRTSTLTITDSEIFMAPSVHLWWSSQVPGAPSGQGYNWTYIEALYPSAYRHQATYQMTIGTDGIYSGIQMPTRSDGSYGNSVLFSVWDNGDVEQDRNLPDYMRAAAVDIGPGAYATRFGGEGTGSSIRFNDDNLWRFDEWVQFLYNVRPDNTTITTADGTTIEYESTLQSMWFKMADDEEWRYIGTLRMAGANRLTSGIYSFLENFADIGGNLMRRCYFRNGAMRSAATGEWYALNHAGYGHTQDNGNRYSRYDYGHGVTALYDNAFYLESGGYMGRRDSADTYTAPLPGEMPWVDTIDIDRLNQRIDLAVTRNKSKTTLSRIEATRIVSNPATWKVINYSDEETVGEGDNGRAAFILDGNTSTYYHNKWKNGSVGFPHTFTIEAVEPVTVSSIELYQSRDRSYRASQLTLQVSDDGKAWTTAAAHIAVEDSDYPTIQLPEAVSARFFRLRFTAGYGSNLVINEVYFKDEYRLEDMLALTRDILEESDQYGGYAPVDVEALRLLYADGTCTDVEALRQAIEHIATEALPLTYGVVAKAEHFTPLAVYQIHNQNGRGDITATAEDEPTIAATNVATAAEVYQLPCSVTDPRCNWLILHSEKYNDYYLYNLGAGKFLNVNGTTISLADVPTSFVLGTVDNGFVFSTQGKYLCVKPTAEVSVGLSTSKGLTAVFQLRTNYSLKADEELVHELTTEAACALHEDNNPEYLFQLAAETYAKAFVAEPQWDTRLIRSSSLLTSNANTTEQAQHNLDKLLDRNKSTYYETWYSGITWPQEMSYLQARFTKDLNAFCFSFIPSQNAEYGLPDIPTDIIVSASLTPKNFLPVARFTKNMPSAISESYQSPVIFTDGPVRNLRFQVMRTIGNRADSHIFAMSEFQVHDAVIDEEASPYYQKAWVKEAFDALQVQMQTIRPLITSGTVTADDRDALHEAIARAEQALQESDAIREIPMTANGRSQTADRQYFDLSGRRLPQHQTLRPGIYIVRDGRHTRKLVP